ncbi:MAG: hypothetical protein SPI60_01115 [Campylobacter lanienae]|nr:hypothetical protein [Campylobacter lanienae]
MGGVFGCGGGIGSLRVAFLDTTAKFGGEIWQRNLTMVKNKSLIVVAITGGHRPKFSDGWLLLGGGGLIAFS